ncbi:MAG: hypothetical protein ABIH46_00510 [Chloroflexota bacterium]
MRSLSSTLLAAQRNASRVPYVKVEILERVAGVARFPWSRLYNGGEPDSHHAVTMPADGSLIRARVDSTSHQLYVQRVINPGPSSDFSSWTALCTASSASGIALASQGSAVLLFYVGVDQQTIYVRESSDYGATFNDPVLAATASGTAGWLTVAMKEGGTVALFYSVAGAVYAVKRTGGTWGSPSAWSNNLSGISGLACVYAGDWNLAVTGADVSDRHGRWTCLYGDGYSQSVDTWSTLVEVTLSSAGSNVEFRCPSLACPDVFRLYYVERYTGTASYSRPFWSHSLPTAEFLSNLWREPVPFNLASSYGLAMTYSGSYVWLSTPSGVWHAPLLPSSVEVSGDVLELTTWAEPTSGKVRVVLRNDDGRYLTLGAGSYAAIKLGSELRVSLGYRTTAGQECSLGPSYWIEGWEHTSGQRRASLTLHGCDGWGLLNNWKARRQYSWEAGAKNVFQVLSFVLARAGLEVSSFSYSNAMVNHQPAFTINPRESGAEAVQRLLAMVPDVLFFRGSRVYTKNPLSSDDSAYGYGAEHAIFEGRYSSPAQSANWAQVYGSSVVGQSFYWEDLGNVYDRLVQVHDLNLGTAEKAAARGDALLRKSAVAANRGEISVPVNCGAEIYDVIDITDATGGLSAAKRRVSGLTLHYSAKEARYIQQLALGGV